LFSDLDIYLRKFNYTLIDFIIYRENPGYFFGEKHEIHFAPCGDAIYMFDDNKSGQDLIKKALITNRMGYTSLAQHLLKNTGLKDEDKLNLIHLSSKNDGHSLKNALKDLLPPKLLRLLKKSHF
jgi:hypothetical protein